MANHSWKKCSISFIMSMINVFRESFERNKIILSKGNFIFKIFKYKQADKPVKLAKYIRGENEIYNYVN